MNTTKIRQVAALALGLGMVIWSAPESIAQSKPASTTASFHIAGTIVSAAGGSPLASARVYIVDVKDQKNQRSLVTGDDGRFAFTSVPAGKYSLEGAKRGFEAAGYDQHEEFATAIVTGAGLDTENLTLHLQPSAMLSGKVLDEAGEPIRNANVTLYRQDHLTGVNRILRFGMEQTDDQGTYEFAALPPGVYFVSATATPWYATHAPGRDQKETPAETSVDPSLDVAYPTTYYADSTDPDDALPIPVKGGDRAEVTLHLNPQPALRLRFHVEGDGEHGFTMPSLQKPSLDGADYVQTNDVQMISPGLWEFNSIAAGKYLVRLQPQEAGNNTGGEIEMNFTSDGEELDASKAEANGLVRAKIKMAGGTELPEDLSLELLNAKGRPVTGNQVSAKGEVEMQSVQPGQYHFDAVGPNKAYSVMAVSDHGQAVAGHSINVAAGSTIEVVLTIAEGSAKVEGFVQKNGKPVAGAMVVLVPHDAESNRELFRRDQSDLDGSFVLRNVAPGDYTVVAIENGWDLDWSAPAVIAYYLKHGQAVSIRTGAAGSEHLAANVEVQSR